MDKKKLLALASHANKTIEEIKKEDPKLFQEIKAKANRNIKKSLALHFLRASKEARKLVEDVDLDIEADDDIKQKLKAAAKSSTLSKDGKKEIDKRLDAFTLPGKTSDLINTNIPIKLNPIFSPDLRKAEVLTLSDMVKLSEAKSQKLLKRIPSLSALTDDNIKVLVDDSDITDKEAVSLGLSASLFRLTDGNDALTQKLSATKLSQFGGKEIKHLNQLTRLSLSDWETLIKDDAIKVPNNLSKNKYARYLVKKVELLYPSDSILAQAAETRAADAKSDLDVLKPIFSKNAQALSVSDLSHLDLQGVPNNKRKEAETAFNNTRSFTNSFPGMGLDAIVESNQLTSAKKVEAIDQKIGALDTLFNNNQGLELIHLDYSVDSQDIDKINFNGLSNEEQQQTLTYLKTNQRTYTLTKDAKDSQIILSHGYYSAANIVDAGYDSFVTDTGFETTVASTYYNNALATVGHTSIAVGGIVDSIWGGFDFTDVGNVGPSIEDYFKQFDGYEELFGSQDYCQCEHCSSILSPSAYFADLMCFIETNILDKVFTGDQEDHVLSLKVRRPDLWELPLTCENTDTEIPQLVIVKEIFENYIATKKGFAGNLNDRSAVETFVYKQHLQSSKGSFFQPYLNPLKSLETYLSHFDISRGLITDLLDADSEVIASAYLHLSHEAYQLISEAKTTQSFLKNIYNVDFSFSSNNVDKFDAQLLLQPMDITRSELGQLVETKYITHNGGEPITIKSEKLSSQSVQNDIERIQGLKTTSLDRMHRFVRLWRATGWTISELDLVLKHFASAGLSTGIEDATLARIADLIKLKKRSNLSIEELCTLWSNIPTTSVTEGKDSLLDRLFNLPVFVNVDGTYPKPAKDFIHPAFLDDPTSSADHYTAQRLYAGMGVSDDTLQQIISYLATPLGIDLSSTNEADKAFNLTHENLTLLYRHAKLMNWLKLSATELFGLIQLESGIAGDHIETLNELIIFLEFNDWKLTSSYSLDDLNYLTGNPVTDTASYPDASTTIDNMIGAIESDNSFLFADTVFAYLEDVTEDQSKAIIADNSSVFISSGDSYHLADTYDPATALTLPAGVTASDADLKTVLEPYSISEILPVLLGKQLLIDAEDARSYIDMLDINYVGVSYVNILLQTEGDKSPLIDLANQVTTLDTLLGDYKLSPQILEIISDNGELFEISDFNNITIDAIHALSQYDQFIDRI
ncbi:MAG: hypothetical protein KZQ73_07175, partial [Candidatus Thiodiazotropha sp. (ex Semelilucina semeliformis)]|nr:hypothetical protein [Candidatus Thiodiazotropha sp. (ex Semelilucina semeliformis)]